MNVLNDDTQRHIVPRWRDSRATLRTNELNALSKAENSIALNVQLQESADAYMMEKVDTWRTIKTLPIATELVGAAFVLNYQEIAVDAAEFILTQETEASPQALHLARLLLNREFHRSSQEYESNEQSIDTEAVSQKKVASIRAKLRNMPNNPIAWIDLSRHYSVLGLNEKAVRAMRTGLSLAPEHRFSLRSAARLFVHIDDPETALSVLRGNELVKEDPWLMASEIAVSRIIEKSPRSVKAGRRILTLQRHAPTHTAELAAALGSIELEHGSQKRAKKLFTQSLNDPNDNTVAQVEWASRNVAGILIPPQHLKLPAAYEARAWEFFVGGLWHESLRECFYWLLDEPFSSRPATLGSFIASSVLEDFETGLILVRQGLRANANDFILLNNEVFILASTNRIVEAKKISKAVNTQSLSDENKVTWLATSGLIQYRSGNPIAGRLMYEQSATLAQGLKSSSKVMEATALIFLVKEEIRQGNLGVSNLLEKIASLIKDTVSPSQGYLPYLLKKTESEYRQVLQASAPV